MKKRILFLVLISAFAQHYAAFGQAYAFPVFPLITTSHFGFRRHPITGEGGFHDGVDLRAKGCEVRSVFNGLVSASGYHRYLGNFVSISKGELKATYGHLSASLVVPGSKVLAGEVIGMSGSTGRTTAEHLHFSLSYRSRQINPLKFLFFLQSSKDTKLITP